MFTGTVVGLDVHANSITAAILEGSSKDPEVVTLPADLMKIRRLFRRLADRGPVRSCYETSGAGNVHVRRLLVEAAWNNHHRTGAELILQRRRQGQPPEVVAIALKAQHRLYKKFWRLDQRKHRHVAITAVARELCGFIWAILNVLPQQQH